MWDLIAMKAYSEKEMIAMWPQAAGELSGLASHLHNTNAELTAGQLRMAIQMANAYLEIIKSKEGVFVHQCPSPPES